MYVKFENKCRTIRATLSYPSYDRRSWGVESKMSLTLWHPIALIGFLSRNRARVWGEWRRRCRWGMIWRTCAVAQSSRLLSLLSPPPLLPLCLTLQHRPYHEGWRNAACWIPAWYRPCRGLFGTKKAAVMRMTPKKTSSMARKIWNLIGVEVWRS